MMSETSRTLTKTPTSLDFVKESRRTASCEIDLAKIEAAQAVLGTANLADTIDMALDEVVARRRRLELVTLLTTPGMHDLSDDAVMSQAWPI